MHREFSPTYGSTQGVNIIIDIFLYKPDLLKLKNLPDRLSLGSIYYQDRI